MKPNGKLFATSLMAIALGAASSASAAIHVLPDLTRPANGASITTAFDFVPTIGSTQWTNTPANIINLQDSLYLTATVSWTAVANAGAFSVGFYANDGGGAGRWGVATQGNGFGISGGNSYAAGDPDAGGPATAAPAVATVNKTTTTTVTLVLKVNQIQAATSPGGDFWYTNTAQQAAAAGFMWISPNLGNTEASQPTSIAQWRSSNAAYQGVNITSDTATVDLNFTNIRIYTGADTPFSLVPEPSAALLGGLGLLALLRRRR